MRIPTIAALAAAGLVLVPMHAVAHDEHALHALTVIESVRPSIEGIEVRIVHLDAPALAVRNDTSQTLTVLGERGEPFLQIGPDGVRANAESPTTYVSTAPRREIVPPDVKVSARPEWVVFSESPSWTWFDPRLRVEPNRTTWEVPFMLEGQPLLAEGGFEPLQGHGHFLTEMAPPDIEGLDMRLTQGPIPAVFVRNDTGKVLHVPGDADEPFLQIGPDGVRANLRSPTYYTSGSTSILKVPSIADASARPRWKEVSPHPVWAWLERRAAVPAELFQRGALGAERRTILEWESHYRLGSDPLAVSGHVDWIPPRGGGVDLQGSESVPWWLIAAVTVAAVSAAAALVIRRPRPAS